MRILQNDRGEKRIMKNITRLNIFATQEETDEVRRLLEKVQESTAEVARMGMMIVTAISQRYAMAHGLPEAMQRSYTIDINTGEFVQLV